MRTNKSLKSKIVRDQLARSVLASRRFAREHEEVKENYKRMRGIYTFTLGYFTQAVDNALREQEESK